MRRRATFEGTHGAIYARRLTGDGILAGALQADTRSGLQPGASAYGVQGPRECSRVFPPAGADRFPAEINVQRPRRCCREVWALVKAAGVAADTLHAPSNVVAQSAPNRGAEEVMARFGADPTGSGNSLQSEHEGGHVFEVQNAPAGGHGS